jgi:hypothetical protein
MEVKALSSAINISCQSMYVVNGSHVEAVSTVCKKSVWLLKSVILCLHHHHDKTLALTCIQSRHFDTSVRKNTGSIFEYLAYVCNNFNNTESQMRLLANAFCEALLEPECGFLCLLRYVEAECVYQAFLMIIELGMPIAA